MSPQIDRVNIERLADEMIAAANEADDGWGARCLRVRQRFCVSFIVARLAHLGDRSALADQLVADGALAAPPSEGA